MKYLALYESFGSIEDLAKEYANFDDVYWKDKIGSTRDETFCEGGLCAVVSIEFIDWAEKKGYKGLEELTIDLPKKYHVVDPHGMGEMIEHHTAVLDGDTIIDFTARQFSHLKDKPIPWIISKEEWKKSFV